MLTVLPADIRPKVQGILQTSVNTSVELKSLTPFGGGVYKQRGKT